MALLHQGHRNNFMTMRRRQFCAAVAATTLTGPTALASEKDRANPRALRVMGYNVYGMRGFPADHPDLRQPVAQGKMPEAIAHKLGEYRPDIVCLAESPRDKKLTEELAKRLELQHARFPGAGNWPGTILSRFNMKNPQIAPIAGGDRPEDLFTRHWGRVELDLPAQDPLILHTLHLMPGGKNQPIRLREIDAVLENLKPDLRDSRSVVVVGDLNHKPETEDHRRWTDAGLTDCFAKVGKGLGATFRADRLDQRIDYILAAGPIVDRLRSAAALTGRGFTIDPDRPDEPCALSDHLPVLASFE